MDVPKMQNFCIIAEV